jgi:hypothetical protein
MEKDDSESARKDTKPSAGMKSIPSITIEPESESGAPPGGAPQGIKGDQDKTTTPAPEQSLTVSLPPEPGDEQSGSGTLAPRKLSKAGSALSLKATTLKVRSLLLAGSEDTIKQLKSHEPTSTTQLQASTLQRRLSTSNVTGRGTGVYMYR